MVNTPAFKAMLAMHKATQNDIADLLGLSVSAVNSRINGSIEFRRNEINAIRKRYELTDAETMAIFFN